MLGDEGKGLRVKVQEVIGARMRGQREQLDLTQTQLGLLLGIRLGGRWTRQTVSVAEGGGRQFSAAELVGVADALTTTLPVLFTPVAGGTGVELPSGLLLTPTRMRRILTGTAAPDHGAGHGDRTAELVNELVRRVLSGRDNLDQLLADARRLHDHVCGVGERTEASSAP